jgi:hypothetical protein
LQTSFAYWYAFFYGRHNKSLGDCEYLLTQAYKYDSDNELYPLILAALFFKFERYEQGEEILNNLFSLNDIFDIKNHPACPVICARTMGKLNISEFIPFIKKASAQGKPYATIVMLVTEYTDKMHKSDYLLRLGSCKEPGSWAGRFYQACSGQVKLNSKI